MYKKIWSYFNKNIWLLFVLVLGVLSLVLTFTRLSERQVLKQKAQVSGVDHTDFKVGFESETGTIFSNVDKEIKVSIINKSLTTAHSFGSASVTVSYDPIFTLTPDSLDCYNIGNKIGEEINTTTRKISLTCFVAAGGPSIYVRPGTSVPLITFKLGLAPNRPTTTTRGNVTVTYAAIPNIETLNNTVGSMGSLILNVSGITTPAPTCGTLNVSCGTPNPCCDGFYCNVDNLCLPESALTPIVDTGSIEGYVFVDTNQNQVRDAGEVGIPNVAVNFKLGTVSKGSANSYTSGWFGKQNLAVGTYTLTVGTVSGYTNTMPLTRTVVLTPGQVKIGQNFGFKIAAVATNTPTPLPCSTYVTMPSCNAASCSWYDRCGKCAVAGTPINTVCGIPTATTTPGANCPRGEFGNLNCDALALIDGLDIAVMLRDWAVAGPVPVARAGQHSADIVVDNKVNEQDLGKLLDNLKTE